MNRAARRWLLLTSLTTCFVGCFSAGRNLNVMHMGPPYEVVTYDRGRPIAERKLEAMSPEEQVIARWIEMNRQGWRPSTAKQGPGRVVKGEGFTLNFTEDTCYLYIPPDATGKPKGKRKPQTEPILMQKRLIPGDMELAQVLGGGP